MIWLIDLDEFMQGYMECALWSSTDPETEDPLDGQYGIEDFDAATRADIQIDCAKFIEDNQAELLAFSELTGRPADHLGHDFWLTRNGHGAGFWDRYMEAEPENRDRVKAIGYNLTQSCKKYGEVCLLPVSGGKVGT